MASTRETMVAKYGGEEGYKAHMRDIRAKVDMKNHAGGSFKTDKKQASEMGKRGAYARWNKTTKPDQASSTGVSPTKEK